MQGEIDGLDAELADVQVHRQIMCASDVHGQHGDVKDVVVKCVLYREAVREISRWSAKRHTGYVEKLLQHPDQGARFAFLASLQDAWHHAFFQCPASLLGIGIGVFVKMWEIPFIIKERNPACRVIRWKNRRNLSWLWIGRIERVRSVEDGCMFGVVGRGVF